VSSGPPIAPSHRENILSQYLYSPTQHSHTQESYKLIGCPEEHTKGIHPYGCIFLATRLSYINIYKLIVNSEEYKNVEVKTKMVN
jgi:hypothetical protein